MLLLNGVGDLVMKDKEKVEVLKALLPLFFTSKVSPALGPHRALYA